MSEPVRIDLARVYEAVQQLGQKMDTFILDITVKFALLEQRVSSIERDGVEEQKSRDSERTRRWQGWLQVGAWLVAIGMGTLAIVLK